jgi:nucleotide-binding universal stress UspA family protein
MTIKSILVATDLSIQENVAVQRAWQLADTHRTTVTLMYMPMRGHEVASNTANRLAHAAKQLEESLGLRVKTAPVKAHKLDDLARHAEGMGLVVLPHRRERSTAAFFRGQPVLGLLRRASCPVLVVRQPHTAPYRRALVAVDFSPQSRALVKLAADFEPQSELEIFHAIGTGQEAKLRSAQATDQALRAYRDRCARDARDRMVLLTDSFDARRNRFFTVIGRGDPGRQTVVQQENSGADLVVVGKARSSAWGDFVCGSVAHRVLSWGSSDVLVVPLPYLPATAPMAARRAAALLREEGRKRDDFAFPGSHGPARDSCTGATP